MPNTRVLLQTKLQLLQIPFLRLSEGQWIKYNGLSPPMHHDHVINRLVYLMKAKAQTPTDSIAGSSPKRRWSDLYYI